MIKNLNEINRLLIAVDKLSTKPMKGALESSVVTFCKNMVIEGQFPNHKETIEFGLAIRIIEETRNRLKLTTLGRELLSLNPELKYEMNERQKEYFTKTCLLRGFLISETIKILEQFGLAYASRTYRWSPVDNKPLTGNMQIVEIMKQSGLLEDVNGMLEVDPHFIGAVRNIIKPKGMVTLDELSEKLRIAENVGAIAEHIALEFEIQRLQKLNCELEAECVQKISELNVVAGYDIASFDGQTPILVHNRFIEVKGSTSKKIAFYLSENELDKARELTSKYWIYFIPNVNLSKKSSDSKPVLIQDPANTILANENFNFKCVSYFLEEK